MANFIRKQQEFLKNLTPEFLDTLSPEELRDVEWMMEDEESSGRQTRVGMLGALANEKTRNRAIRNFDIGPSLTALSEVGEGALRSLSPLAPRPGTESDGFIAGITRLVKGGLESLRPGGSAVVPRPAISPEGELFQGAIEEEGSHITDAEKFVEDPARALATLSMLFSPLKGVGVTGKTGSIVRGIGRVGELADPIIATGKGASLLAKGGAKAVPVVTKGIAEALGLTTGQGSPAARALVDIGKTSSAARRRLSAAERGQPIPIEQAKVDLRASRQDEAARRGIIEGDSAQLGLEATGELKAKSRELGAAKGDFLETAGEIDVSDLREELLGDLSRGGEGGLLKRLRIKVEPVGEQTSGLAIKDPAFKGTTRFDIKVPKSFSKTDRVKIQEGLADILEGPDLISVQELDDFKQGLDAIPAPSPKARRALTVIRERVRAKLGEVEGFDDVSDPISELNLKLEGTDEAVGIQQGLGTGELLPAKGRANPAQVGRSFEGAFDTGPALKSKQKSLAQYDELVPGTDIRSRAAGQRFQGVLPTGLVGKNQFMQQITTLGSVVGVGAVASTGIVPALLSLPLLPIAFSPTVAGRTLLKLGVAQEKIGAATELLQRLATQAQATGIGLNRSMTIGQVLGRMPDFPGPAPGVFEDDKQSLMGRIGNATAR